MEFLREERAAPNDEHLGPYYCGPACLMLDATGQVALKLIDIDGPEDPRVTDPWTAEDSIKDYERGAAARAFAKAEKIVPLLHRAGFHLTTAEGKEARVTDLADTWQHGSLTVSKSNLNEFSRAMGQPSNQAIRRRSGQQPLQQAPRLPSNPPVLSGNPAAPQTEFEIPPRAWAAQRRPVPLQAVAVRLCGQATEAGIRCPAVTPGLGKVRLPVSNPSRADAIIGVVPAWNIAQTRRGGA